MESLVELEMRRLVVAVDGVSGSGKTTMARKAAQRLNFFYLETGSFYRAFTLRVRQEKIDYQNLCQVKSLLRETKIYFHWDGEKVKIYLNGKEVTEELRQPEIDRLVSFVSEIREVREKMVLIQREMAEGRSVICEGRDIGSVVFPNADLKVFVDCDLKERARRRKEELAKKGISLSLREIMRNLKERDRIDSLREVSPLVRLPEAIYINTSNLTIEEEVNLLVHLIKSL